MWKKYEYQVEVFHISPDETNGDTLIADVNLA